MAGITNDQKARDELHRPRFSVEWKNKQHEKYPVTSQPADGTVLSKGKEIVVLIDKDTKQRYELVLPPGRYHKATLMDVVKKAHREDGWPLGKAWTKACAEARVPNVAPALAFDCCVGGHSDHPDAHYNQMTNLFGPKLVVITPEGFQREDNRTERTVPWHFHGMPLRPSAKDPTKLEPIPLEDIQVEWWYLKGMQDALQCNFGSPNTWTCDFFSDESKLSQAEWDAAVASLRAQLQRVPYCTVLAAVPRMLRYYSDGSLSSQTGDHVRAAWHLGQGHVAPLIYEGPALALRLQLNDFVLPGRVYVDYTGKFICSDWCQREVGKQGGIDLIHGGTTKHTLLTWLAGPATSRFGEDAQLSAKQQVRRLKPLPHGGGTFKPTGMTLPELMERFPQRVQAHPTSLLVQDWIQQVVDNPRVHAREVFTCAGPLLTSVHDVIPLEWIKRHNQQISSMFSQYRLPEDAPVSFQAASEMLPSHLCWPGVRGQLLQGNKLQYVDLIIPYREAPTGARRFVRISHGYVLTAGNMAHRTDRHVLGFTQGTSPYTTERGRIILRRGERTQFGSSILPVDTEQVLTLSFREITSFARSSTAKQYFGHEPVHIRPSRYLKKVGPLQEATCSP